MSDFLANWTLLLMIWIALAIPVSLLVAAVIHRGRQ